MPRRKGTINAGGNPKTAQDEAFCLGVVTGVSSAMRLVASLKAGLVAWSAMLRKLAAYERQNQVDIALALLSVFSTPCPLQRIGKRSPDGAAISMVDTDTGYEFVQLTRTFHELSKYALENDDADLSQAFHVGEQLTWIDLTKQYRLVILSEAGSGKTAEIRNIARDLRAEGKAAFFLRLENIPNDFEDAFEVGSLDAFEKWLASGDEGWLLLDSVDEARLRNPGDFELAIRKLGRRIITALDRTHIVIAGRTTAWRPKTDLSLCVLHLPFTPTTTTATDDDQTDVDEPTENVETVHTEDRAKDKEKSIFKIVALDDLASGQIEAFAGARGITDTKSFLEAVERADAKISFLQQFKPFDRRNCRRTPQPAHAFELLYPFHPASPIKIAQSYL